MKVSTYSSTPVYTISHGSDEKSLPQWLSQKRKKSLKRDAEYARRVELLQDFEFEEASECIKISEDGEWIMSTGTYKPQMHIHYAPHLSLSYSRHTDNLNKKFVILSTDASKSLHLQTNRVLELHTSMGLRNATKIPRYGRDLVYHRQSAEALIPAVGIGPDGTGEVFRLNLELGRFMKGYSVGVTMDDLLDPVGGNIPGQSTVGAVNTAAVAEESHDLLAFGTSLGSIEICDPRSRSRAGLIFPRFDGSISGQARAEVTALDFDRSGLRIAAGASDGTMQVFDLRSPVPIVKKDQGYGLPIKALKFLEFKSYAGAQSSDPRILSMDKRIIKIWNRDSGKTWAAVEPSVDLNDVAWCPDSGLLLTANEGKMQNAFLIPSLGPAPKWCAFLDRIVEEMTEDLDDPAAYKPDLRGEGPDGSEIFTDQKFLTKAQLEQLNIDHLIGHSQYLHPYMHGYFVSRRLYDEARLAANPDLILRQREKTIRERFERERESRIRGTKAAQSSKAKAKVNRKLMERLKQQEQAIEERRLGREDKPDETTDCAESTGAAREVESRDTSSTKPRPETANRLLSDSRFSQLFMDKDFEIDEESEVFRALNPGSVQRPTKDVIKRDEIVAEIDDEETGAEPGKLSSGRMRASDISFKREKKTATGAGNHSGGTQKKSQQEASKMKNRHITPSKPQRRSASGNVMRRLRL